jgi:nicotinamidase/pyrazinamidase
MSSGEVEGESEMSRFVIVVDAQRDFIAADGALSVPGADALVGPLNAWLAELRPEDTDGILLTFDTHEPERYARSPEAEQFPPHCVKGQPGWESMVDIGSIDPAIPLYRLEKSVFAMWEEADLALEDARDPGAAPLPRDRFFAAMKARGVADVTVVGVAADYCVRWAIDGLVERGFRVEVPAALTRGIARQIEAVVADEWPAGAVRIA